MAVVHFGARAFDQRSPPLNALAVVAALLVAVDPLSVADPAFVLTCGATLGISAHRGDVDSLILSLSKGDGRLVVRQAHHEREATGTPRR